MTEGEFFLPLSFPQSPKSCNGTTRIEKRGSSVVIEVVWNHQNQKKEKFSRHRGRMEPPEPKKGEVQSS